MFSGPPHDDAPPPQGIGALLEMEIRSDVLEVLCPSSTLPKFCGLGTVIKAIAGSVLLTASALSATVGNPAIAGFVAIVSVAEYMPCGPPAGAANSACTKHDAPAAKVNGGALGQVTWLMLKSVALVPDTVRPVTWIEFVEEGFDRVTLAVLAVWLLPKATTPANTEVGETFKATEPATVPVIEMD